MIKRMRIYYVLLAILVLFVTTVGATYAYWTATTSSASGSVKTESTIYSISMKITPLYSDFSFIPMNDTDVLKALRNQCKDKYGRGACSAYSVHVYDYRDDLGYISGSLDITTNNISNLSYMMLRISDTYDEDSCILVEDTSYCITKEATSMGTGEALSLGDSYDVLGTTDTNFILVFWLTNLNTSQNAYDIGSFHAMVTFMAGNGGEIKGSIASSIQIEDVGTGE